MTSQWVGRLLGRRAFWLVAMALVFGVPVVRSVVRGLPAPPPRLGAVALPDATLADRPFVAADAAHVATLMALHRRLAHLGDGFSLVVVGGAVPPGHSPRIWRAVAATPAAAALVADGRLALVDAASELRGRYDPDSAAARDALVAALGLLVNTARTR